MAFLFPIKYFNSFWLKKVVGDTNFNPQTEILTACPTGTYDNESTVTTWTTGGWKSSAKYLLPTWPGLPWGNDLTTVDPLNNDLRKGYPCYPFGGRDWSSYDPLNGGSLDLPECGGSLISRNPTAEAGRERNWFVEEARIRGGYNNTSVDFGAKAYAVEDENQSQHLTSTLIYSGIFNSKTGINNTNVFSTAEPITRRVDPLNGSIQKLYAYNTNLTIFQENKVSQALIDKDAIYSAEGAGTVTSTNLVIGQITPYAGTYGISKNPESWSQYAFRQYFTDKYRSAVLRLSGNGITEISNYGMTDYFRDQLAVIDDEVILMKAGLQFFNDSLSPTDTLLSFEVINNTPCDCESIEIGSLITVNGIELPELFVVSVTSGANCLILSSIRWSPATFGLPDYPALEDADLQFVFYKKDRIIGGFDNYNKNYVLSLQAYKQGGNSCQPEIKNRVIDVDTYGTIPATLSFDEAINGWVSYYTYIPQFINSLKNNFYSGVGSSLYQHYSLNQPRGEFYGTEYNSSVEFIFNTSPSVVKNFLTVGYEGSSGWQVDHFVSDFTEFDKLGSTWIPTQDTSNRVWSYYQGEYTDPLTGTIKHGGFYRKENKYVANLVNSSDPTIGEVVFGQAMSGIKGYFATVKFSTDINTTNFNGDPLEATDLGGMKELYAVSSNWVTSSI